VEKPGHPAHRAIAVERRHGRIGHLRHEPNRPAMTTAVDFHPAAVRSAGRQDKLATGSDEDRTPAACKLPAVRTRPGEHFDAAGAH